jgi:hypothetical protein
MEFSTSVEFSSGALKGVRECREAAAAAKRLGVRYVTRSADGSWRPTVPWQGSREATERADRAMRVTQALRDMRTTPCASALSPDRARRLERLERELGLSQ